MPQLHEHLRRLVSAIVVLVLKVGPKTWPERERDLLMRRWWSPRWEDQIRMEKQSQRLVIRHRVEINVEALFVVGLWTHPQKLSLFSHFLHSLQLSEPLLQQSNGGTNHSRFMAFPAHMWVWYGNYRELGFLCKLWMSSLEVSKVWFVYTGVESNESRELFDMQKWVLVYIGKSIG